MPAAPEISKTAEAIETGAGAGLIIPADHPLPIIPADDPRARN
jgi:hypothetical protein